MKTSILFVLLLTAGSVVAADAPDKTPQLAFHVVDHFFKFPDNYILAEAVGVAVGPQGHILTANRGNHPLIEFNADGSFIRSFGEARPLSTRLTAFATIRRATSGTSTRGTT
jgi:hypothetical protein